MAYPNYSGNFTLDANATVDATIIGLPTTIRTLQIQILQEILEIV